MITKIYVFIAGIVDTPVLAGELSLLPNKTTTFKYSRCYTDRSGSFCIDPENLPLSFDVYHSDSVNSTFGVFTDACGDSWGKKVLHSIHSIKPSNILEYLLANSGKGVGCIRFSLSPDSVESRQYQNTLADIPQLITAKNEILSGDRLSPKSASLLSKSIGIGGARPKSIVTIDNIDYIVKFQRKDDKFNYVRAEHTAMTLLQKISSNTAHTKVLEDFDEDVLLVKRFDYPRAESPRHFISANSIINMNRVKEPMASDRYSYGFLAEFILQNGFDPVEDAEELYKRMVFNALIGNTDDHARNHGLLCTIYTLQPRRWRLSPAYDVLPISNSQQHALGIGSFGRRGSIPNLLSQYERFNLNRTQAVNILQEIKRLVSLKG